MLHQKHMPTYACNIEAETCVFGNNHIECIAHAQFTSLCFHTWWGATILYLPVLLQSRVMPWGNKCNSTDQITSSSKKRKATNSIAKNCLTYHSTRVRARTGEDAIEPLTRSDIPVLVKEVVSTLTVQENSQVAGQVINSEEGSSSGTTP